MTVDINRSQGSAPSGLISAFQQAPLRVQLLTVALLAAATILTAAFVMRIGAEDAGSNTYALLADAWLQGRLDVDNCYDADCASYNGKQYIIFPPAPGLVTLPFVALSPEGSKFSHFMVIGAMLWAGIGFLWWRIYRSADTDTTKALLLVTAFLFATPLFYVGIRADRVWFFAQLNGVFFISLAIWASFVRRNAWLAGLFVGMAFLCRQMMVFYVPFIFILMLREDQKIFRFSRENIALALRVGLPVLAAVAVYCTYNTLRFSGPLDTGYSYIAKEAVPGGIDVISSRIEDIGLWSPDYFIFNAVHMFFQGLHVEFALPHMTQITGVDPFGTAILVASPFLFLLFFVPKHRITAAGLLTAAFICGITLFYHGNGFSQYNVQRFALDWLPMIMLLMAPAVSGSRKPLLALLVTYAMAMNIVTLGALKLAGVS